MDTVGQILQESAEALRKALGWIVISLVGGSLFALKRGRFKFREVLVELYKAVAVGCLGGLLINLADWPPEVKAVGVAAVAFGANTIIALLDKAWTTTGENPGGVARGLYGWFAHRQLPPPPSPPRRPRAEEEDREP
jgi:hypothetical protein